MHLRDLPWIRREVLFGPTRQLLLRLRPAQPFVSGDHSVDLIWIRGHEIIDALTTRGGVRSSRPEPKLHMNAASTLVRETILGQ